MITVILITCIIVYIIYNRKRFICDDNIVYEYLFNPKYNNISTTIAYKKILHNFVKPNSKILDIGVGSGMYFESNDVGNIIKTNNLLINGIDIDANAIKICKKRVIDYDLSENVNVDTLNLFNHTDKYDVILFMESFPVMSDDYFLKMYNYSKEHLLNPGGKIICFHNLTYNKSIIKSYVKPRLKNIIGIDFGKCTTLKHMEHILPNAQIIKFMESAQNSYNIYNVLFLNTCLFYRINMVILLYVYLIVHIFKLDKIEQFIMIE